MTDQKFDLDLAVDAVQMLRNRERESSYSHAASGIELSYDLAFDTHIFRYFFHALKQLE
jgi:hypothetical protein